MIHEIYPKKYDPTFRNRTIENNDYLLSYHKDGVLVKKSGKTWALPRYEDYRQIVKESFNNIETRSLYFFEISGEFYYGITLSEEINEGIPFLNKYDEALSEIEGDGFFYIRIHIFRELDPLYMVFAGATGYHFRNWSNASKYCGCCGGKTQPSNIERAFVCEKCGHTLYPQVAPAVIVAIKNNDKILLVKNKRRPKNVRLELVSGYVEVGESFEQAVHREVFEEVGLKVKNVKLYKDQPWGISGAHMIGFVAEVDGDDDVVRQEDEISEASWYSREEIPEYRNRLSVGSELILSFKNGII